MVKLIHYIGQRLSHEKRNVPLDVQTIHATVDGEKWVVERAIDHYSNHSPLLYKNGKIA